eukprot:TRINITY_DN2848_c0_g3_i1.p1 TRINITY_DN2848_c0_g3~~TRINITY_DN2848_c0_g3_i1.p1  ORF type:complete len:847 (+),score=138.68 TRINITY_DN2848_c0_g3_i1:50-2590(+)
MPADEWERHFDAYSARHYYLNRRTRETKWTGPTSKEPPAQWECLFCTYKNPSSRGVCDACGKQKGFQPRPKPKPTPKVVGALPHRPRQTPQSTWQCSSCTFENQHGKLECEICGTRNGGSAPAAPAAVGTATRVPETAQPAGWSCERCTTLNAPGPECSVCGTPRAGRPGAGSPAVSSMPARQSSLPLSVGGGEMLSSLSDQASEWRQRVSDIERECRGRRCQWTDETFPPGDASLNGPNGDHQAFCPADTREIRVWERPRALHGGRFSLGGMLGIGGGWRLSNTDRSGRPVFLPSDICQGHLGDCWFLSALAVVCTRQDLIRRVMISDKVSESGIYCCRFSHNGVWTPVLVDDMFPADVHGRLAFAHPSDAAGKVLWVSVVEKAYAKLHGSFRAICAGSAFDALTKLTGVPCQTVHLQSNGDDAEADAIDPDLVWGRLESYRLSECLMAASCDRRDTPPEASRALGLVPNHCFTVLGVMVVRDRQGTPVRLLRLRNPWGHSDWNGPWSFRSPLWTDELRRECGMTTDSKDGCFIIAFDDFLKHFSNISVCMTYENWISKSVTNKFSVLHNPSRLTAQFTDRYLLRLTEPTWMFVSVVQQDERGADAVYQYRDAGVLVLKGEGQQATIVGGVLARIDRMVTCEVNLEPGTYTLLPYSLLNHVDDMPFALALWSSKPFELERASPNVHLVARAVQLAATRPSLFSDVKTSNSGSTAGGRSRLVSMHSSSAGQYFVLLNDSDRWCTVSLDCRDSRNLKSSRGSMVVTDSVPPRAHQVILVLSPLCRHAPWSYSCVRSLRPSAGPGHDPPLPEGGSLHDIFHVVPPPSRPREVFAAPPQLFRALGHLLS